MKEKPLVSIHCLAYNQARYIRQCLDGFVNQKTNFKFEVVIHDDCSTDGTVDIIREYASRYPEIIVPIFEKENQYSKVGFSGISKIMLPYLRGKYLAFCEGDDFWTDSNKLQKEVDYLETHPHCGMVYTDMMVLEETTGKTWPVRVPEYNFEKLILSDNLIYTASTCMRKDIYDEYFSKVCPKKDWLMGDYPLWLFVSLKSDLFHMQDITGTYRLLPVSAVHQKDYRKSVAFVMSFNDIGLFFLKKNHKENLERKFNQFSLNKLFDISAEFNKNLTKTISRFASTKSLFSVRIFLKILCYSSSFGRKIVKNC